MLKNIKIWLDSQQRLFRVLLLIYILILTWLLLRPGGGDNIEVLGLDISIVYNDKIIHGIVFFMLTILNCLSFKNVRVLYILILSTFYGILIEFLQEYMALGRTFEYNDILADFIGSVIGILIIVIINRNV